jgi:membrane protease YdiL (CAAX protease family)
MHLEANSPSSSMINMLLFAAGIGLFALYIQGNGLAPFIAIAGLLLPAFALYRMVIAIGDAHKIWGNSKSRKFQLAFMFTGVAVGIAAGILYRQSIGSDNFPANITLFALIAAAIGATEEILFRGVVFYLMQKQHIFITIIISALLHASYKSLLFLSPFIQHPVDTWYLFYVTFLAGIVLGILRYFAASIAPPLLAHSTWDILVYGHSDEAPWWVW